MGSKDDTAWKRTLYEAIGRECQKKRNAAGLTVKNVAARLGVSYQLVSRVEAGDNASTHYLAAFAQLARCSVADLIPVMPYTFNREIDKDDCDG